MKEDIAAIILAASCLSRIKPSRRYHFRPLQSDATCDRLDEEEERYQEKYGMENIRKAEARRLQKAQKRAENIRKSREGKRS